MIYGLCESSKIHGIPHVRYSKSRGTEVSPLGRTRVQPDLIVKLKSEKVFSFFITQPETRYHMKFRAHKICAYSLHILPFCYSTFGYIRASSIPTLRCLGKVNFDESRPPRF